MGFASLTHHSVFRLTTRIARWSVLNAEHAGTLHSWRERLRLFIAGHFERVIVRADGKTGKLSVAWARFIARISRPDAVMERGWNVCLRVHAWIHAVGMHGGLQVYNVSFNMSPGSPADWRPPLRGPPNYEYACQPQSSRRDHSQRGPFNPRAREPFISVFVPAFSGCSCVESRRFISLSGGRNEWGKEGWCFAERQRCIKENRVAAPRKIFNTGIGDGPVFPWSIKPQCPTFLLAGLGIIHPSSRNLILLLTQGASWFPFFQRSGNECVWPRKAFVWYPVILSQVWTTNWPRFGCVSFQKLSECHF